MIATKESVDRSRVRQALERATHTQAGIVDKQIDATPTFHDQCCESLDILGATCIGLYGEHFGARFGPDLLSA